MVDGIQVIHVIDETSLPLLDYMDTLDTLAYLLLSSMPSLDKERIGIVGLGAIGGSLALALNDRASPLAWSRDQRDRVAAAAAGIAVCREATWATEMRACTAVIIAVPLNEIPSVVGELLPHLPETSLVMHVSSLQRPDALRLSQRDIERVVGTHPIAGSERSGFGGANGAMFRDATIRAEARATETTRRRIEAVWRAAGVTRFIWDDAATHDELMAWISHLPQLTATALAAVLADHDVAVQDAGPGARDTTRLAASDPAMWAPLLQNAPHETVSALRRLTSQLDALCEALETHDERSVAETWQRARSWRARVEDQR